MGNHLTVEETDLSIKHTVNTVRRWLCDGTIHVRKLGRVWRIPESEMLPLGNERAANKGAVKS